jgi:hypothetical protein
MSAEQALAQLKQPLGRKPDNRDAAATWLSQQLTNGPKPAGDILDDAEAQGFSIRTVRRAFDELGGKRTKGGFNGGWIWSIPEGDTEHAEHTPAKDWPLRNLRENKREEVLKNCLRAKGTDSLDPEGTDSFEDFEAERLECNGYHDEPPF